MEMKFVRFLGKGTYGSVNLYSYDGSYEAVKSSNLKYHSALEKECRILTQLKGSPGIVQLAEDIDRLVEEPDSEGNRTFHMPMEFASGGSLSGLIRTGNKLSDSVIKDFTRMILQGLVSLHSAGYVHCDLKPDNLLLFPRFQNENCPYDVKIADFGVSTKAGEQSELWDVGAPFVGTYRYMSPESVQECFVEQTLDLWSLGCIVLEMYTGKYPWFGLGRNEVEYNLMYDTAPTIPESVVPCDARRFIEKCFSRKAEERGTASELLSHPFLMAQETMQRKRKAEAESDDISTKKLKSTPPNPIHFKPLRMEKILPPRSDCVPVQ